MTLLRPAYSLIAGTQQWTCQLIELDLVLVPGPGIEELTVTLPAAAPFKAEPGDPVSLDLDGGEGSAAVFAGQITAVRRGLRTTSVTAHGALGQLAHYYPATTFENARAGTVIRALAEDAGLGTADIADGVSLPFYAADPSRNASQHAARLAAWSGAMLLPTADGKVSAVIIDASQATVALRHGRELTGFAADTAARGAAITVAGESGAGDASAPEAMRLSTDVFSGNRPEGPSLGTAWNWEPALRTASAAATAGAALRRSQSAGESTARLDAFLLPRLRPGTVVEIQDLPDGFAKGPYWIEQVRHRIDRRGAVTSARLMQGGDSFDPLALLGSAAGALAGALAGAF
jgi:hypothetical protein